LLFALPAAVILAVGAAGCTADGAAPATQQEVSNVAAQVPADDEAAIRRTIDALNATSAGTVANQQAALATSVEPALTSALDDCPPATTTLRFEPIYPALRASPDWTSSTGTLTGTVYALPTLLRIFTGDRMTGTDLTTLHLAVQAGEAFTTPLCVG
jgi:hypothetical protein